MPTGCFGSLTLPSNKSTRIRVLYYELCVKGKCHRFKTSRKEARCPASNVGRQA